MSKLISGKEALIALANGEEIEACVTYRLKKDEWHWFDAKNLTVNEIEAMETEGDPDGENIRAIAFRLKPRTITINGIEVPAPFEPKDDDEKENSYVITLGGEKFHWRASSDYKQVVSALRSVFKPQ